MSIFKNQGKLFELLLYYKLKDSGLFSDVQTGVKISWSSDSKSFEDLLMEEICRSDRYGFENYNVSFNKARKRFFALYRNVSVENEIDIVLTNGMTPTFISCKTSKTVASEELYEISSIAKHFRAKAVLAVTKDLDKSSNELLLLRAKQMNVSLIGFETIFDESRMNNAVKMIANGKVVFGSETKK